MPQDAATARPAVRTRHRVLRRRARARRHFFRGASRGNARHSGGGGQRQDGAAEDGPGLAASRKRARSSCSAKTSRKLSEKQLFDVRSKIGMLFQESALFDSLDIEENVAYPLLNQTSIQYPAPRRYSRAWRRRCEFVELEQRWRNFRASFPAACAGARRSRGPWSPNPPLVLYDSPTAGLDPITAHTIIALLIKERDMQPDHHADGDASLSGWESDGEFPLQFGTRASLEPARNGASGRANDFHGDAGRPAGLRGRPGPA